MNLKSAVAIVGISLIFGCSNQSKINPISTFVKQDQMMMTSSVSTYSAYPLIIVSTQYDTSQSDIESYIEQLISKNKNRNILDK